MITAVIIVLTLAAWINIALMVHARMQWRRERARAERYRNAWLSARARARQMSGFAIGVLLSEEHPRRAMFPWVGVVQETQASRAAEQEAMRAKLRDMDAAVRRRLEGE